MTKRELIDRVYRKHGKDAGLTKKTVASLIDGVFGELGDYFIKTQIKGTSTPRFTYPGFGTFAKRKQGARVTTHPRTGDKIEIPECTTVRFVVGRDLKSLLNEK